MVILLTHRSEVQTCGFVFNGAYQCKITVLSPPPGSSFAKCGNSKGLKKLPENAMINYKI